MEIIRSRQNSFVKQLIKLAAHRRERVKTRQTLLIGTHLIDAAAKAGFPLQKILIAEHHENRQEITQLIQRCQTPCLLLDSNLFTDIEQSPSSAGILALADIPDQAEPATQGFCLLLEDIQDPGNVGSILRTAAGAGVDQVWLTPNCADIWSPKVLRAGMGAHFLIPTLEHINAQDLLGRFHGEIISTSLQESHSLYDSKLQGSLVLIMGNEGNGVSSELTALSTQRIHIPMATDLESLNVAAATAICLFERKRQVLHSAGG